MKRTIIDTTKRKNTKKNDNRIISAAVIISSKHYSYDEFIDAVNRGKKGE